MLRSILSAGHKASQPRRRSLRPTIDALEGRHLLSVTMTPVMPQTPIVTWERPTPIVYGTPLNANQLDASSNVPGTFSYTLANADPTTNDVLTAGTDRSAWKTVLHAGLDQILTVTFTPTDVNYKPIVQTRTLDVLQAPLTVTANNASVVYGQPIPALTGTVSGLVYGDTNAFVFTLPATQGSPAGQYTINPTPPANPGLDYNDYAISFTTGTLTVTPAPLTVTVNNASVAFNQPIPTLTGTVSGLVNGDHDAFIFTTTAVKGSPIGQYTISPTPPANPGLDYNNYAISFTTGTLTIYNPVIAGVTLSAQGDLQITSQLLSGNVVSIAPATSGWVSLTVNGVSEEFAASSVNYVHYNGSIGGHDSFTTSFVPTGYTYAQVWGTGNLLVNQAATGLGYWSINGSYNTLITVGGTNDVITSGPRYTDSFYGPVTFLN